MLEQEDIARADSRIPILMRCQATATSSRSVARQPRRSGGRHLEVDHQGAGVGNEQVLATHGELIMKQNRSIRLIFHIDCSVLILSEGLPERAMADQVPTDKPLRIAQLAPSAESVPPKLYGGTERVVSRLTEELVLLGHRVTLLASGDSVTSANLIRVWPRAIRLRRPRPDPTLAYGVQLQQLAEIAGEFDVIHCHVDWGHLTVLSCLQVPFLTTLHGRLEVPYLDAALARFPSAPFVSISNSQRRPVPNVNWIGTIYHGLPKDLFL